MHFMRSTDSFFRAFGSDFWIKKPNSTKNGKWIDCVIQLHLLFFVQKKTCRQRLFQFLAFLAVEQLFELFEKTISLFQYLNFYALSFRHLVNWRCHYECTKRNKKLTFFLFFFAFRNSQSVVSQRWKRINESEWKREYHSRNNKNKIKSN